jgi:hypothetical protein
MVLALTCKCPDLQGLVLTHGNNVKQFEARGTHCELLRVVPHSLVWQLINFGHYVIFYMMGPFGRGC